MDLQEAAGSIRRDTPKVKLESIAKPMIDASAAAPLINVEDARLLLR